MGMSRKLLVFGNGLGLSINPSRYNLAQALEASWQDAEILTEDQKSLIHQCLPASVVEEFGDSPPQSESELEHYRRLFRLAMRYKSINRKTVRIG